MMSWNPRRPRRNEPSAEVQAELAHYERVLLEREAFEEALVVVMDHARPMLRCPQCGESTANATGWTRHQQIEATRNFFTCSSCYCDFFHDSDVLSSCALAALAVYDRCMMYSTIDEVESFDQINLTVHDETDS